MKEPQNIGLHNFKQVNLFIYRHEHGERIYRVWASRAGDLEFGSRLSQTNDL